MEDQIRSRIQELIAQRDQIGSQIKQNLALRGQIGSPIDQKLALCGQIGSHSLPARSEAWMRRALNHGVVSPSRTATIGSALRHGQISLCEREVDLL